MRKSASAQLSIARDGLFLSRRLANDITDSAPTARRLVKDHFGRRPLKGVELVLTSAKRIPVLAALSQGTAAGVPDDVYAHKTLSFTRNPRDLYSVAVIAPNNTIEILLNAKRLRRRPQELGATLVFAFVEVEQLCRKGAWDRRIALTRHEMGTETLPKSKARSLYRIEAELEAEAEAVTQKIVGKVIRQNRQAENEAAHEVRQAESAAA
ncbi:hypothetical protein OG709_35825 (plasmid) [Streptomyces sp. NBC_01267]|uniref:hypothetical protein n=1 Tax=Streptomyces sp. NBC_01267 TaxID=2903805 RepID=UPI002E371F24|nr:hypothetical protein [Streptomyces sp. NBC_01267]